jgi:uncharacterized protein (TIGR00251 family)
MRRSGDEVLLDVRARPGAGRSRLKGIKDGRLRVDVAAAPERGKANAELVKFIGKLLGVPKADVRVRSGTRSRNKVLGISGVDAKRVEAVINRVCGGTQ